MEGLEEVSERDKDQLAGSKASKRCTKSYTELILLEAENKKPNHSIKA